MKEGAIIHHVLASSISLAPPQAAGLTHSAARPLPEKSFDFSGTPCAIALCKAKGCQFKRHPLLGFVVQITGASPCAVSRLPEGGDPLFPAHILQYPSGNEANGSPPLPEPPIRAANGCFRNTT